MEHWYASFWMIGSAFLYSLQNVDAHFSEKMFGFWTVCVFRGAIGSLVSYIFLWVRKDPIYTKINMKLLVARSMLGGATIITLFFSLLHCDLSTTTIITSTSSLWTAWIGNFFLPTKYKWSCRDVVIVLWCISGIVITCLNNPYQQSLWYYIGIVCALLSALFQSGVNLTIKYLEKEPTMLVSFWGVLGSMMLGMPGFVYEIYKKPFFFFLNTTTLKQPYSVEIISLLTTGILSVVAQYCKTYAIQQSKHMSVLILRYMDILFSILWDIFLFHQHKTWHTFVGMGIVLSGCVVKLSVDYYFIDKLLPLYSTSGSISMDTTRGVAVRG